MKRLTLLLFSFSILTIGVLVIFFSLENYKCFNKLFLSWGLDPLTGQPDTTYSCQLRALDTFFVKSLPFTLIFAWICVYARNDSLSLKLKKVGKGILIVLIFFQAFVLFFPFSMDRGDIGYSKGQPCIAATGLRHATYVFETTNPIEKFGHGSSWCFFQYEIGE